MIRYKNASFTVGKDTYYLSTAEMELKNWQMICDYIADDVLTAKRFQIPEFRNLLGLFLDTRYINSSKLPDLYSDIANIGPTVVETYCSLLSDLDVRNIKIVKNGVYDEKQTALAQGWLSDLSELGFLALYRKLIMSGCIYGTMFLTLQPDVDDPSIIRGTSRDAVACFPQFALGSSTPTSLYINYKNTDRGKATEASWTEAYYPGEILVYKNGKIIPELSSQLNIEQASFVAVPFEVGTKDFEGRSPIWQLVESIVKACGVVGSGLNNYRKMNGGITIISAEDPNSLNASLKGNTGEKNPEATVDSWLNADEASIIVGKGLSIQQTASGIGSELASIVGVIEGMLEKKSPVYAWIRLGANASGVAIEQTKLELKSRIESVRGNVETLINSTIHKLAAFYNYSEFGDTKILWQDVFPKTRMEKIAEVKELLSLGIYDKKIAAEVLGETSTPGVIELLDKDNV